MLIYHVHDTEVEIPGLTYEHFLLLGFPGCGDEAEAEAGCESQADKGLRNQREP